MVVLEPFFTCVHVSNFVGRIRFNLIPFSYSINVFVSNAGSDNRKENSQAMGSQTAPYVGGDFSLTNLFWEPGRIG